MWCKPERINGLERRNSKMLDMHCLLYFISSSDDETDERWWAQDDNSNDDGPR